MKYKPKRIKTIFFLLFLLSLSTSFVFAQGTENEYPVIPGASTPNASTSFPAAIKYLFNFAMFIGALFVLGVLVWSGFRYITSGNNPAVTGDIKKRIYAAFLGLLILLSSYVILATIQPGLTIISLPLIFPASTSTPPVITVATSSAAFQEIPLGTIIEDLLAGNASTTNHPDLRCYKYDSAGNMIDVNGDGKINGDDTFNYNSFYCVSLINDAFETKVKEFINIINSQLKPLMNGCICGNCAPYQTAYYNAGNVCKVYPCGTSNDCGTVYCCDSHCQCCGAARGEDPGCPKKDPCPAAVRTSIDCKRQEIKQLLDGGELLDKSGKLICPSAYDPAKDPEKTPDTKFTTLQALADKAEAFHQAFLADYNDLKEAELLMKSPYGKRLTMQEFFALKTTSSKKIEKVEFKTYNTSEYCKDFNCVGIGGNGLCNACKLNSENRMCKIDNKGTEYYVTTGDNATFYLGNDEEYRKENIIPGEKCIIDPKVENGFQVGLIPIGETVDEAEKFAIKILALYDYLSDNYQNTMASVSSLLNLPEGCNCSRCHNKSACWWPNTCGKSCSSPSCTSCSNCIINDGEQRKDPHDSTGLAWQWYSDPCGGGYYIPYMEPLPNVCPVEEIDKEMKKVDNGNPSNYFCCNYSTTTTERLRAKIATSTSWGSTKTTITLYIERSMGKTLKNPYTIKKEVITYPEPLGYLQIIEMVYQKMYDLFYYISPDPDDVNRCPILDKLTISREKMMKCITGFGVPDKESMAKERTLSCSSAWDSIRSLDYSLVILPSFPNPVKTGYLNCYPYNSVDLTSAQKLQCLQNRNSPECAASAYYLLDNYYCCSGGNN